ncbi:MAG: type II and III secretion system protein family protein, partial [Staphylococcus hominis]
MRSKLLRPSLLPLAAALAASAIATAPAPATAQTAAGRVLQINTGRGELITLASPMSDLFIADDKIADVQVRSPTRLYIFGKAAGETNISATNRAGKVVWSSVVRVGTNLESVGDMLRVALPDSQITVTPMNGLMLLTGAVRSPEDASEAERLAQAFVGDSTKVLSRLKVATPLQVNLQVRFAEVSRSFLKQINVRFTGNDVAQPAGGAFFNGVAGNAGTITGDGSGGILFGFLPGATRTSLSLGGRLLGTNILGALDVGETIGQVTTLANPNLTALSGETGNFLAGGEFPIPINQGLGAVSVEYKSYGIGLTYSPTVLSDGRISLRVRPEVSQLSDAGSVQISGTTIPALTTRRAETTVELGSGQSFMIAGLLQNNHQNSIDKTPFLGDLPIIGALFRSNRFTRSETELVIIVTPYLVKPV